MLHVGEMIVNVEIVEKCERIFTKLLQNNFSIEKMVLIDNYYSPEDPEDFDKSILDDRSIAGVVVC